MNKIVIIDYGSGNIKSVFNAVKKITEEKVKISSTIKELKSASHLILPGVGSFESCITGLTKTNIIGDLQEIVFEKKVPFLGICVGMQMLATRGFEKGSFLGLNWIKGEVRKIKTPKKNLKIPHMGWNTLIFKRKTKFTDRLLEKIKMDYTDEITAYFVHSYNFKTKNECDKIISTNYGEEITAMVSKENIFGTQFHPEKSHTFGLAFLKTFLEQKA